MHVRSIGVILCLGGAFQMMSTIQTHAQIKYLTVPTLHSPLPPGSMFVAPSSSGTSPTPTPAPPTLARAPAPPVLVVPPKPSMDKAELEQHVVAFQKQRATEGSASAQYQLGLRYLKGDGVEKDLTTARRWLGLAAQNGETAAATKLAELGPAPAPTKSEGR